VRNGHTTRRGQRPPVRTRFAISDDLTSPGDEASIDEGLRHLPLRAETPATHPRGDLPMPTDRRHDPPTAPPAVDLSDVLVAAAHAAGYDLDLDELVVVTALRTEPVLHLIHAAAQLATTRW